MREIVGVNSRFWHHHAPPKQSLLLYDRLVYPRFEDEDIMSSERDAAIIDVLHDKGIIHDLVVRAPGARGYIWSFEEGKNSSFIELDDWNLHGTDGAPTMRAICLKLAEQHGIDALPLEWDRSRYEKENMVEADIARVLIKALPVLEDTTPWEAIVEYQSDPESSRHRLSLRRWMRRMAKEAIPAAELEDELEFLVNEYQQHMKLHRLRYSLGAMESIVLVGAEFLENLLHLKFSAAAKAVFELRNQKLALLEAEMTAPGKKIAYIVKTRENFGAKVAHNSGRCTGRQAPPVSFHPVLRPSLVILS